MNDAWAPETRLSNSLARGRAFCVMVSILIHTHTVAASVSAGWLIIRSRTRPLLAFKLHSACLNSIYKKKNWPQIPAFIYSDRRLCLHVKALNGTSGFGSPLNRKRNSPKSVVPLSWCTDKNIWVAAAAAARVLSVCMTRPKLTSAHPPIRHGVAIIKRNTHMWAFVMSLQ